MSGSFVDYLLPTAADTISFDTAHTTSPSTTNTLGTKGVGEAGTIASTPAVVNAIVDAVRHLGINDIQMPCTPERVWKAISSGGGGSDPTEESAMPHFAEGDLNQDRGETGLHGRSRPVIPAQFDYVAPATIEEALGALAEHGDEAKIMAGGQSLLPVLRMRLNAPEVVIDLGKIDALRGVRDDGDAIVIGAMTPHSVVGSDPLVEEHALLIHQAVEHLADAQIRHRGTFGGALAHADPAGDMGAPALALGAQFVIAGSGGTRTVEADDFFVDLFETAIGDDEILTEVRVPKFTGWGAHYEKFVRVAHQWPIVAVAAAVRAEGGTIAEARVGLTNMGSTPLRARGVEAALAGQPATADAVRAAAEQAAEGTNPPSDLNGDADYRRHLAGVLTRRAVLAAAGADAWISHTGSPSPPRSRRPGRTSRTSRPSRSASPEPRSPRRRVTVQRLGEGQARADRARLQRLGHVHREGRGRPPVRRRRQGQGQAGQRHGRGQGHARHGAGRPAAPTSRCSPTSRSPASRRSSAAVSCRTSPTSCSASSWPASSSGSAPRPPAPAPDEPRLHTRPRSHRPPAGPSR